MEIESTFAFEITQFLSAIFTDSEFYINFALMLFNSFEFALFLPIVFLVYWLVCRGRLTRNLWIVAASYLFYGWWDIRFLFLIIFTSLCSYASGILIEKNKSKGAKRAWLSCNIILNLGILCLFKYFNFFSHSFAAILRLIGFTPDDVTLNLILPVGISFYSFQALSYSIDVYRKDIEATKNLPAFLAFISFFPQLVAGPIERATNLLPQFQRPAKFNYSEGVSGLQMILWGLFKKVVVADNAAPIVNTIFSNITGTEPINLWIGAILFSFQIYGDFSGYSDMAIGIARLFGISLMKNFNMPYLATDIHDFWKRWHISLTSWFRDYVYIPLGGNRKGRFRKAINTMAVFLISGLWHGADLTFILWGAYHGALYLPPPIHFKA